MRPALAVRPASADEHRTERLALTDALRHVAPGMEWYADRTAPHALTVSPADAELLADLYRAVAAGITSAVRAYLHDKRLQDILTLPEPFVELLRRVDRLPFRAGALRPDFLIDPDGVAQVCEVNARFPVNGFLCSYYTNEIVEGLGHHIGRTMRAVPGLRRTIDVLASRFQPGPLVVLREREGGTEIFALMEELHRRGIDARARTPGDLRVDRGRIHDADGPVDQLILELERDELLELPLELFDAIAATERSFNDVRTLILGHDKRMLAVLGDPSITADLVSAADVELLTRHVIPTFHAGDGRIADELHNDPSGWVLKRNSSGRGIDLLVGGACDLATWRRAIDHEADDRTAQRFVEQLSVTMPAVNGRGELVDEQVHVVGLLPGFDGEPFGPGLFRASVESVINVAGDRGVLVPAMISTG